tara:strand:+ start:7373 stop:7711 length:339 start_codon:yes stop_codon:yes gene_type:complete
MGNPPFVTDHSEEYIICHNMGNYFNAGAQEEPGRILREYATRPRKSELRAAEDEYNEKLHTNERVPATGSDDNAPCMMKIVTDYNETYHIQRARGHVFTRADPLDPPMEEVD